MSDARLLLVAGEVSGDIHGGNLLAELMHLMPRIEPFGIGGDRLEGAGLECLERSEALAHMGLAEVLRELPSIRGIMRDLIREAERRKPRAAVLIDSPDFNLRLARRLSRLSVPVVLYVSPQLWAWRRGRVRSIRKLAREVLCILPFEVDFYRRHGVPARYVGHPLVDDIAELGSDGSALPERSASRLALLPGSRAMEIRGLLPTMLNALQAMPPSEVEEAVLIEAPGVGSTVDMVLGATEEDPRLRRVAGKDRRLQLASCSVAWTASGTATLECALLGVPMVVGYRLHPLTYLIAKALVRVPHAALVNLIADQRVAPELIQGAFSADRLIEETHGILRSTPSLQLDGLAEVRRRLGAAGASLRAARAVAEYLA
jgi:lipid-A-disaccharide synthase